MIWFIFATLQCILLFGIWRLSRKTVLEASEQCSHDSLNAQESLPTVAMIIPATGDNPAMPVALTSLLEQEYPHIIPIIVTANEDDPATKLVRSLQEKFPHVESVIAGQAHTCSQKNYNTLQALAHLGPRADIFAFCDSTHIAKPNFLYELVQPIVKGEAGFSTGYHTVEAEDDKTVTLAYQFSVLLMRLLQAIAVFTQPWGGAMAISRTLFEEHKIADIWKENVVDDCSLAAMLIKRRVHVRLCPKAILCTKSKDHDINIWQAWMQRQVLFLKFCVISQWYLLGFFSALLLLPVVFSCFTILGGLTNILDIEHAWYSILAIAHLGILSYIVLGWRELLPRKTPAKAWLMAFSLGIFMFARVFIQTLSAWSIDWHGIRYHVKKNGKLIRMEKI